MLPNIPGTDAEARPRECWQKVWSLTYRSKILLVGPEKIARFLPDRSGKILGKFSGGALGKITSSARPVLGTVPGRSAEVLRHPDQELLHGRSPKKLLWVLPSFWCKILATFSGGAFWEVDDLLRNS